MTLVVRGDRLDTHMADYLVRDIGRHDNVEVRLGTEIIDGEGDRFLEAVRVRDRANGTEATLATRTLFVLIGADRTPTGSQASRPATRTASSSRAVSSSAPVRAGPWTARRFRSRPACPACSRSATCAAAPASASPPPSAKGRRSSPRSTSTSVRNTMIGWSFLSGRSPGTPARYMVKPRHRHGGEHPRPVRDPVSASRQDASRNAGDQTPLT